MNRELRIGIAGLGAIGSEVARRIDAGIPGLTLAAVAVRDPDQVNRILGRRDLEIASFARLAEACDLVVECLPPALFPEIAVPVVAKMPAPIVAPTPNAVRCHLPSERLSPPCSATSASKSATDFLANIPFMPD